MPFRTIPDTNVQYGLISFDANGQERRDDPDGRDGVMSKRLLEHAPDATNVFFFSHGWMGDVPAAVDQYNRWIGAFVNSTADRQRADKVFPGFKPLFIGLHWPSLPWGDEELGDGSFGGEDGVGPDDLYRVYLERLGDTPAVRASLAAIIDEARKNAAPARLSDRARDAFMNLNDALGLRSDGPGGAPDCDREPFDPDAVIAAGDDTSFGAIDDVFSGMLGALRLCSYWAMKKRGRMVGECGMHSFINELQRRTKARVHLMGHSFGCVVTSSILGGPDGDGPLERPIDSVMLAQGAVSLWSYAPSIPFPGLGPGYFHRVLPQGKVGGPVVTTQSRLDTAVGVQYPRASILARQISFDAEELPKYGAIGTFGLQGLASDLASDRKLLPADGDYGFAAGKLYNLEGTEFIKKMKGSSGAHNDIDGPEVAHAIWQAAFASV